MRDHYRNTSDSKQINDVLRSRENFFFRQSVCLENIRFDCEDGDDDEDFNRRNKQNKADSRRKKKIIKTVFKEI